MAGSLSHEQLVQRGETRVVSSTQELFEALGTPDVSEVQLTQNLDEVPSLKLRPGQVLSGHLHRPTLTFVHESDGIELSADTQLRGLRLFVEPRRCAVRFAPDADHLGRVLLEDIETVGRVCLIMQHQQGKGHLDVRGLHIDAADATQELEQPAGYGVSVLQGAFTLWNKRQGPDSEFTADLLDISVGRRSAPVLGSGVFVSGADKNATSLFVQRLRTGAVYSNGSILVGTPDRISGGVFVVHGASADLVENVGPTFTFGANDMALDNWGRVDRWIAREKVTTFGPSAIGFVNFGALDQLTVQAPIETHGAGARGYNVYDGTVQDAEFDRIVTYGDGAVGVQISQPIGTLAIQRGIETHGGKGQSLVKGVMTELSAVALSIKPGGVVQDLSVRGGLLARAEGVPALEQDGEIKRFSVHGGFGKGR